MNTQKNVRITEIIEKYADIQMVPLIRGHLGLGLLKASKENLPALFTEAKSFV